MNQKEIAELRRRWRPEKSAVSRIYGCFVNSSHEIVSDLDESLGMMPQEEAEKYLGLLKKALSGTLGKNLIDIVFSTQQVMDSEEHRLLSALRASGLKDGGPGRRFTKRLLTRWIWGMTTTYCCWPMTHTTSPAGERMTRCRRTPPTRCFPISSAAYAR